MSDQRFAVVIGTGQSHCFAFTTFHGLLCASSFFVTHLLHCVPCQPDIDIFKCPADVCMPACALQPSTTEPKPVCYGPQTACQHTHTWAATIKLSC